MESKGAPPRTARVIIAAFAAVLLLKVFVVDFVIAEGNSMLPTVQPGTVILVNRIAYGVPSPFGASYLLRWALPKAGDIVLFHAPDGRLAIKRCGPYDGEASTFFALGDNPAQSQDSRNYGPIRVDAIIGRAVGLR